MTNSHHHAGGECDTRGRHGMLLFGEDPWYLSHLPMYHCPHHYQVLLEVDLDEPAATTLETDRASNCRSSRSCTSRSTSSPEFTDNGRRTR